MRRIVSWFVRDPVASNLLTILIFIGGVFGAMSMGKEVFPSVQVDYIRIVMPYLGAGPQEVEEQILIPIEEAIYSIDGVAGLDSVAWQGGGQVMVEVEAGYDKTKLTNHIKTNIDTITTFPRESERPEVTEEVFRERVMTVALSGDAATDVLIDFAEKVRDDLSRLPQVESVELQGIRAPVISIELEEYQMRRFDISFEEVVAAVQRSSITMPAGSIRGENGTLQLQTSGQAFNESQFNEILVSSLPDGTKISLGDVASVMETFEETFFEARLNSEKMIFIQVYTEDNPDVVASTDAVKNYVLNETSFLPGNLKIKTVQDHSIMYQDRLNLITKNAIGGLILVFIILMLFLRPILALWVSFGIGIAYAGALWLLPAAGVTISMASMFAFLLILGIIVDDAIIVGESIYRHQEEGYEVHEAAELGAHRVLVPVVLAVTTTIILFAIMFFLPGSFVKAIWAIPIVAVIALSFSLLECLCILPSHLAHMGPEKPPKTYFAWQLQHLRQKCSNTLLKICNNRYQPLLAKALEWRYLTILCFLIALIFANSLLNAGHIKKQFMPNVPWDYVGLEISMPDNYSKTQMMSLLKKAEAAAEVLDSDSVLKEQGLDGKVVLNTLAFLFGYDITVWIELSPSVTEVIDTAIIGERWIHHLGKIPEASNYQALTGFGAKEDQGFSVLINSNDSTQLNAAKTHMLKSLMEIQGVSRVLDTSESSGMDLNISLKPNGNNFGVGLTDVANQVRQGFYGAEAQRIARDREELRVLVRYPESARKNVETLSDMRIRTSDGKEIPFYSVAEIEYVEGVTRIRRVNRERTSRIRAYEQKSLITTDEISKIVFDEIRPELARKYPSVRLSKDGFSSDEKEFYEAATKLLITAIVIIYGLMVLTFKSYLKPLGVLTAIPFGLMGAIFGHVLFGLEFSMMSWMGVFAATGVVVNDNLVLIERINQLRQGGLAVSQALMRAGKDRFRPIILTSLTTFIGLMPIIFEPSEQAQFLVPMVISLVFGVLFATTVTLIFVPAIYLTAASFRDYLRGTKLPTASL
ncbi:MAG: hypothetical protein CMK36_06745 [Porticoccaceae bacterium]|nr:hypothetical protein [Porticoccaceae bacterium]